MTESRVEHLTERQAVARLGREICASIRRNDLDGLACELAERVHGDHPDDDASVDEFHRRFRDPLIANALRWAANVQLKK